MHSFIRPHSIGYLNPNPREKDSKSPEENSVFSEFSVSGHEYLIMSLRLFESPS